MALAVWSLAAVGAGWAGAPFAGGLVVSADPVDWTPQVLDGQVNAIVQVGSRMVVGGSFTQVRPAGSSAILTRHNLFAFDARTGAVDTRFVPEPDRRVAALTPAPDGRSVFVGGAFDNIAGVPTRKLAKLDASTGRPVPGFRVSIHTAVEDLDFDGRRLLVAGAFTVLNRLPRFGLAALDPVTGTTDGTVDLAFTDPRSGTATVKKIDVSPDGSRLVALGNFTRVSGQERTQIAVVDLTTTPASLADWHTHRYQDPCSAAFPSNVRDVDISPDGSYFVVVTTGGRSAPTLCDAAARWELGARGSNLEPTWVDNTGGDTLTAVAVTDAAVYVGGHQRWMNNPHNQGTGIDATGGPGAVPRSGIAALDPANGLPLSWNPGRKRGAGVFAFLATPDGLWAGSDTELLGGERRPRLALLPVEGGTAVPAVHPATLPGTLYTLGPGGSADLVAQAFDGETVGPSTPAATGIDWSRARGVFMMNGKLYAGWDDGSFDIRGFDGASLGPPSPVDLHGLTGAEFPVAAVTGMFFDAGRLYYTVSGDARLFYRYFTPESDVVGAETFVASGDGDGLNWRAVQGITLASGHLYWSSSAGNLKRIDFVNGRPVPGTTSVLTGPARGDTRSFRSRGMFLFQGEDSP